MITAFLKALFSTLLGGCFKLFAINRDEEIGQLKEDNKTLTEQANDINKANAARSDAELLKRVRSKFTRNE